MTQLTRAEFLNRYRTRSIDLTSAASNATVVAELRAAGTDVDRMLRATDRQGPLGQIQGDAELRAVFDNLRALNPAGANALLLADRHGNQTNAGRALHALDVLFSSGGAAAPTPIRLSAPVGAGQPNRAQDVRALQQRLKDIGFDIDVDGKYGNQTAGILRVCRATLSDTNDVSGVRALVQNNDVVMRMLNARDPLRWQELPASGPGFVNHDRDHHDYAWSLLVDVVRTAGATYAREYMRRHPRAAPIATNDASELRGGDTRSHATHENGLDLDLRLPRKDGGSGTQVGSRDFDFEAAYAMVEAFASDNRVARVLFNCSQCIQRARQRGEPWANKLQQAAGHHNHMHVDVKAPRFG
jgi:hypothetical protein